MITARNNPFRSEIMDALPFQPIDTSWGDIMTRIKSLNYRASIVGHHGAGKTTLLDQLEPRLAGLGFDIKHLRLDTTTTSFPRKFMRRFLAGLESNSLILFDGADHMAGRAWQRFLPRTESCAGIVATSHVSGMLPTLVECRTTAELLFRLATELKHDTPRELTDRLFAEHKGNIRLALRELYDIVARTPPRKRGCCDSELVEESPALPVDLRSLGKLGMTDCPVS